MYIIYAINTAEFSDGFTWSAPTEAEAERMVDNDMYFDRDEIDNTIKTEGVTTYQYSRRFNL